MNDQIYNIDETFNLNTNCKIDNNDAFNQHYNYNFPFYNFSKFINCPIVINETKLDTLCKSLIKASLQNSFSNNQKLFLLKQIQGKLENINYISSNLGKYYKIFNIINEINRNNCNIKNSLKIEENFLNNVKLIQNKKLVLLSLKTNIDNQQNIIYKISKK